MSCMNFEIMNLSAMTKGYCCHDMIQGLTEKLTATTTTATATAKKPMLKGALTVRRIRHPAPSSPTLPLLPAHSHQAIEELLPQPHRRHLISLPVPIHNLQPVRDRLARRPADHDLRLPPQPAHLLQFPDVRNRHRELGRRLLGLQARAVGGFGGEGDGGDVDVGGDIDPALAALVAALEVDGAGYLGVVGPWEDAEVVFGVPGAGHGAGFVDAEFGLYACFRGAFKEAEDVLAMSVFLLLSFLMLGLLFRGFLVGIFVYCVVDFFI